MTVFFSRSGLSQQVLMAQLINGTHLNYFISLFWLLSEMNIKIDLCIVMDVTGSMRPWLEEAKHRIGSLAKEIPKTVKSIKGKDVAPRFAFVAPQRLEGTSWMPLSMDLHSTI
jgi:hypothetical protein